MGFSFKKLASKAIPAVGAAAGAFLGGTAGAGVGYNVGNMVSGAVGLGEDDIAAQESMKYQKKMADYAFNQNLQMWNLNNAYNDPSAQMERLEKAGLNKNLVYGGGNVTGNTSGGIPEYSYSGSPYVSKSVQREQLALAMQEHQQRITNQAIENELARERIGLATREADRQDRLADAQIKAYSANLGLTAERIADIRHDNDQPRSQIGKTVADAVDAVKSVVKGAKDAHRGPKHGTNFITGKKF